jgi:hypothetical protein
MRITRLSLAVALVGGLALGAWQTALAADFGPPGATPRYVSKPHWRAVKKRVFVRGCVEVSQPPRGCPVRLYGRLPWPGEPRPDIEFAEYIEGGGWHRCPWGEWC